MSPAKDSCWRGELRFQRTAVPFTLPAASSFTLMAVGMQHSLLTQGQQNPVYSQVTKLACRKI